MRRVIAIALLAVFGLPFATSLFALTPKSEANLPACCRRDGKHHCMMSAAQKAQLLGDATRFRAPLEQCPYLPHAVAIAGHPSLPVPVGMRAVSWACARPVRLADEDHRSHLFRIHSHLKRGPPSTFID